VRVDEDLDAVANLVADRLDDLDGRVVLLRRIVRGIAGQVRGSPLERIELDRRVTLVDRGPGCSRVLLRRLAAVEPAVAVQDQPFVELAAQQLIDR
jgi:hypothetical protein